MNKFLHWLRLMMYLAMAMVVITPIMAFYCYQESANTTNQTGLDGSCNLAYTGLYNYTGVWANPTLMYDGNYSSFGQINFANTGTFYVNYTKPPNVKSSSLWQIEAYVNPAAFVNYSIPASCWNASATKLVLRVDINTPANYKTDIDCYNGSSFNNIHEFGSTSTFYEEGLFWDIYPILNFSVFDELNGSLLSQLVNISVVDVSNPNSSSFSTSNGNIVLNLSADTYLFSLSSQNFTSKSFVVNVSDSSSNFNVYLLRSSSAQNFSLCFYDTGGVRINNLFVNESVLLNSSFVLSQSSFSNVQGKVYFTFNPSSYYQIAYYSPLYVSNPFVLNPPRNDVVLADGCNYDVILTSVSSVLSYSSLNVTGVATFNNSTKIITVNYTSTDSSISNYSFTVSNVVNGTYNIICSGYNSNLFNSSNCNVSGNYGVIFVQLVANNTRVFYSNSFDNPSPQSLFAYLNQQDAGYFAGFIVLLFTMGGLVFGTIGVMISGFGGLFVIYLLQLMTPLTLIVLLINMVVCIIISVGVRR